MPANPIPAWFGFLRIEADLAMTFIDVARSHLEPGRSARSLGNARKALAEIQRCLMKPIESSGLSENEIVFLEQRCREIESALRAFVPPKQDVMLPQSVTDQEIQGWVFQHHGLKIETYWIAHCKELCGLTAAAADSRRDWQMCPPEVQPAVKQAFRYFGMLPAEP